MSKIETITVGNETYELPNKTFRGIQAEWDALTTAQKAEYDFAAFTDDYDPSSISNPNLLDNPWFTINQRGQSSYTADDGNAHYTVDRWAGIQINRKAIKPKANGGITVDYTGTASSTSWYALGQLLDTDVTENLKGKTVTMSIKVSNIQNMANVGFRLLDYDSFTLVSGITEIARIATTTNGISKVTFTMPTSFQGNKILIMIYGATSATEYATAKFDVDAVKLELGSQSTLAMDTIPNYQQELAKCQRYFQRVKCSNSWSPLFVGMFTSNSVRIPFQLCVPMRTKPTAIVSDITKLQAYCNNQNANGTGSLAVNNYPSDNNTLYISLPLGSGITSTNYIAIVFSQDVDLYIDLSADL